MLSIKFSLMVCLVIKVKVISSVVIPVDLSETEARKTTVQVLDDYKGNVAKGQIVLTSEESGSSCDVSLPDGECWIVSGFFHSYPVTNQIEKCGFRQPCREATTFQLNIYRHGHKRLCRADCSILWDKLVEDKEAFRGCIIDLKRHDLQYLQHHASCHPKYSYSVKKPCEWITEDSP